MPLSNGTPDDRAIFESLDQPAEIALKLGGPLQRGEEVSIVERRRLRLARLLLMDMARHELAKQFADRCIARRAFEPPPRLVVDVNARHVITLLRPDGRSRERRRSRDLSQLVTPSA